MPMTITDNHIKQIIFIMTWHLEPTFSKRDLDAVNYILHKFRQNYLFEASVRKFQFDNPDGILRTLPGVVQSVTEK